jgi:hypothetical protein
MKTEFFKEKKGVSTIDHMWVFSTLDEIFLYRRDSGTVVISPSAFSRQRMKEMSTIREATLDEFASLCGDDKDLLDRFAHILPREVEIKPEPKAKAKSTVFGIKPFKGTVTINKSISGPRIVAHREDHCRTKFFDKMSFPYHLAVYLRLIPDGSGLQFTNQFYDLTNEEVDGLTANGSDITSVKRTQNGVIVSLNIS